MAIGTIIAACVGAAVVGSSVASAVSSAKANKVNRANTQETNALNYQMFQEQNTWNREQWELENEYNKPENQMQRYKDAGINPLWAMSDSPPNTAAHLESAEAPTMQAPVYQPVDYSQIGRSLLDGLTQMGQLSLNAKDTSTRALAQQSQADVNKADIEQKKQQTRVLETEADWNEHTFSIRLDQESQKLKNLEAQEAELKSRKDLNEEDKRRLSEVIENLKSERELISARITQVEESVKQNWAQIRINQQNANVNSRAVSLKADELELRNREFVAQVSQWNNENLLNYMYKFGKSTRHNNTAGIKAGVKGGVPGVISGSFEGSYSGLDEERQVLPATQEEMLSTGIKVVTCGVELCKRAKENPTSENLQAASKAVGQIELVVRTIQDSMNLSFDSYSPVPQSSAYESIVFPNVDQMDNFAGW